MTMELCNLHTHTVYCDGELMPEEMVQKALERGLTAIGFAGHSYTAFDPRHSMSERDTVRYMEDINRLKEKYAGEIEIYLGIERELYSDDPPEGFDFVIGSVHYVMKDGDYVCVDAGAKLQKMVADVCYGGDWYAFAEDYFSTAAEVIAHTSADIAGHFDLISKYNLGGALFDESHPRYVNAALAAMDRILQTHKLFEVNTGAMYRLGKPEPYPSSLLLRELYKRGGEVILSSDSHDAESLCYKFDEVTELLRACGFTHVKRLTRDGFIDAPL